MKVLQHIMKKGFFETNPKELNLQMPHPARGRWIRAVPKKVTHSPRFTGRFVAQAGVISGEGARRGSCARCDGFEGVNPHDATCGFPFFRTVMRGVGILRTENSRSGMRRNRRESSDVRTVSRRTGWHRQTSDGNSNTYVLNKSMTVWVGLHSTHRIQ